MKTSIVARFAAVLAALFLSLAAAESRAEGKYQDLWWGGPSQNGWGMSVIQHGENLFAVLFQYGGNLGDPTWLVLPAGTWNAGHSVYSGKLYLPTSSPFYAYEAARFALHGHIGYMTIDFRDDDHAVVYVDMPPNFPLRQFEITRQRFGPAATPLAPDRGDMYWGGAPENGWGLAVIQQYRTLFAVWYTYDARGWPTWYVMPSGTWSEPDLWEGRVYWTSNPTNVIGYNAYDPRRLAVTDVGRFALRFTAGGVVFDWTVGDYRGTRLLVRQPF